MKGYLTSYRVKRVIATGLPLHGCNLEQFVTRFVKKGWGAEVDVRHALTIWTTAGLIQVKEGHITRGPEWNFYVEA